MKLLMYSRAYVLFFLLNIGDENFGFFCAINDYYQIRIWLGQYDGKSHPIKAAKSVEEYKCHKGRKLWIVYRHLFCRFCRYLMTSSILLWTISISLSLFDWTPLSWLVMVVIGGNPNNYHYFNYFYTYFYFYFRMKLNEK